MSYYQQHYDRYNLNNYNVPSITEDVLDDRKMPDDREEIEDEGTAPPVKSGYKPQDSGQKRVVKSGMPKKMAIPQQKMGPRSKNYEQELEQIPPLFAAFLFSRTKCAGTQRSRFQRHN